VTSPILASAARTVAPLLLLFAAFSFLRGHNEPGGGFIGGLVASAAMVLWVLADGTGPVRRTLRFDPRTYMAAGLIIAVLSGVVGAAAGRPYFAGEWFFLPTPFGDAKLGTPILFDVGVLLVVFGAVLTFVFTLSEESGP